VARIRTTLDGPAPPSEPSRAPPAFLLWWCAFQGASHWSLCERRDSNPHAKRRQLLRLVCLPIPPRSRYRWSAMYVKAVWVVGKNGVPFECTHTPRIS
jgi:hypothetical protein